MQQLNYPFKNDHEVVIAMIEDFNNQVSEFNRQQISNSTELLEIKRILMSQNEQMSNRLKVIEDELKDVDIKRIAKTVEANAEWINNFNNTKHIIWVLASLFFGIMGYFLNLAVSYLSHLPR